MSEAGSLSSFQSPRGTLGIGLVGTGMIAGFHARAIAQARGARLAGVAGRTREAAQAWTE